MLLVTSGLRPEFNPVSSKSVSVIRGPGKTCSIIMGRSPEFVWLVVGWQPGLATAGAVFLKVPRHSTSTVE